MRKVDWLHISDLHFDDAKDGYDRTVVLEPMIQALAARYNDGWRPDAVFCTGDIAFSGGNRPGTIGTYPQYELAQTFLSRVLEVLHLKTDKLFVIPGNHDVDRLVKEGYVLPDDPHKADEVLGNLSSHAVLLNRFHGFQWLIRTFLGRDFCPDGRPFSVRRFTAESGVTVGVLELNSAWDAVSESDQGSLVVGERPVREALAQLEQLGPRDVTIALIHHPLDWLRWWDRDRVSDLLESDVDLILRGHLHSSRIDNVTTQFGNVVHLAAGSAFQGRPYLNGFTIGTLDADTRTLWTRQLRFEDRGHGGWTDEWVPPLRGGKGWRVNPPAERSTVIIQQALWPITEETVRSAIDREGMAAPASVEKIVFSEEITDWKAEQDRLREWYGSLGTRINQTPRFTVFSSSQISLGMYLGYLITDRYPVHFYQPEHDGSWSWGGATSGWVPTLHVTGIPGEAVHGAGPVVIRISMSATVSEKDLFDAVPNPLMSIGMAVAEPVRSPVMSQQQVNEIGRQVRALLSRLSDLAPECTEVHFFCAVPTAVAVNIGRQLRRNMDPVVQLWEYHRANSPAYTRSIRFND